MQSKWMISKLPKIPLLSLFFAILFFLAGCSGEVFDRAYTASGDGQKERELTPDELFTPTDDLNVVVKLNKHDDSVEVIARFLDPNDDVLQEVKAEDVPSEVGTVVLGIDYESRGDLPNQWIVGPYRVKILIDGEEVETLFFRVN
jgi:hypothetical protein